MSGDSGLRERVEELAAHFAGTAKAALEHGNPDAKTSSKHVARLLRAALDDNPPTTNGGAR